MAFVSALGFLYVHLKAGANLGFAAGHRLVSIVPESRNSVELIGRMPIGDIEDLTTDVATLEVAVGVLEVSVRSVTFGETVDIELVTKGFSAGLQPKILHGRGFYDDEHANNAGPVAMISHDFWESGFGKDLNVLGRSIPLQIPPRPFSDITEPFTLDVQVVGIAESDVEGIISNQTVAWLPAESLMRTVYGGAAIPSARLFGRLATGASLRSLTRELNAEFQDQQLRFRAVNGLVRNVRAQEEATHQLLLLLVGGTLMALVAVSNLGLFLLARAPTRCREMMIRLSVGAPYWRLQRQLIVETFIVVLAAALLGASISVWITPLLRDLWFLRDAQWLSSIAIDWRVLSAFVALLLLIAFAIAVATLHLIKSSVIGIGIRHVPAKATALQRWIGCIQCATAGSLTAAAISLGSHLAYVELRDPGYSTHDLLVVKWATGMEPRNNASVALIRHREAIRSIPGVSDVAFGMPVPGVGSEFSVGVWQPSNSDRRIQARVGALDASFANLLRLEIVNGHAPSAADGSAVVISQTLAHDLFAREDVVGEKLKIGQLDSEIVGVMKDVSFSHPAGEIEPFVFTNINLGVPPTAVALVSTPMRSVDLRARIQELIDVGRIDSTIAEVASLSTIRGELVATDRARGILTIVGASMAIMLALFGHYQMQRYLVDSAQREYAIRAALGASPRALARLVHFEGMRLTMPGIVIAIFTSFSISSWLRTDLMLVGISPLVNVLIVVIGLVALSIVASSGPARLAGSVRPGAIL